ncbi:hypothetical protein IE53DRAFT_385122 [Violaceomyces palustris]|uniref:Uncharacterized protein n=1 Tax=Violaceomyces palustris TaxID=1673888 RepID=A0ACD0P320_9BASI|nr:hypothetical protein IE53DRAFT_385122 [Violaceomyces palustris]
MAPTGRMAFASSSSIAFLGALARNSATPPSRTGPRLFSLITPLTTRSLRPRSILGIHGPRNICSSAIKLNLSNQNPSQPSSAKSLQEQSESPPKETETNSTSPQYDTLAKGRNPLPPLTKEQVLQKKEELKKVLKSRIENLRPHLLGKLSEMSARWNKYSGYDEVERLKSQVTTLESDLGHLRAQLQEAKNTYLKAVSTRSHSQRQTNDLLSRKSTWSDADLSEYTRLLRSEHSQSRDEEIAEKVLEDAEREVQNGFDRLMKGVMLRYHEEQIWSDRVRSISTYGSLIVVALNALIFILAIIIVEPYKRKKLAQTFEKRLLEGEAKGRELVQATIQDFDLKVQGVLSALERLDEDQNLLLVKAGVRPRGMEAAPENRRNKTREEGSDGNNISEQVERAVASELGLEISMGGTLDDAHSGFLDESESQTAGDPSLDGTEGWRSRVPNFFSWKGMKDQEEEAERRRDAALAATIGVVVGASFSLILGACWGS